MIKNQQKAFTLIELMVVLFIVMLASGIVLASYRTSEKKYALTQASQKLISDLRRAQNMAMSGQDIQVKQYDGYGVYLEEGNNFYIIYADKNNNHAYRSATADVIIETITLPQSVKIQSVSTLSKKMDVCFQPPDPTTYLESKSQAGDSVTVTLQTEGASLNKIITITSAGLVQGN